MSQDTGGPKGIDVNDIYLSLTIVRPNFFRLGARNVDQSPKERCIELLQMSESELEGRVAIRLTMLSYPLKCNSRKNYGK